MADKFQGEVSKMLHSYRIFTRHEKAIPVVSNGRVVAWNTPDRFSPDLVGGLVHQINIEIKTGKASFSFDAITEGQYAYAAKNRIERGCEFWFAIFFVLPYAPEEGSRIKRALFLVPYPELIRAKQRLSAFQKSIPFAIEKGMKREVQEYDLCATNLWKQFRLSYDTKDKWFFPSEHPFVGMYLNQRAHLYRS